MSLPFLCDAPSYRPGMVSLKPEFSLYHTLLFKPKSRYSDMSVVLTVTLSNEILTLRLPVDECVKVIVSER